MRTPARSRSGPPLPRGIGAAKEGRPVTDRRPPILALTAALLLAAGCGGGQEDTPSEKAAKATPTATVESPSRELAAGVDGRELSGHRSGTQQEGSPAIPLDSGMGSGQHQLSDIEERFAASTT